jgi:hypothetical protein
MNCVYGSRMSSEQDFQVMKRLLEKFVQGDVLSNAQCWFADGTCKMLSPSALESVEATLAEIRLMEID